MSNLTKKAIKDSFLELLNDRPLSQITVRDISERCGINRNSFYYHYQDIPALIEEIVTEEADRIIGEYPTFDSIEAGFYAALDFAAKQRNSILHIYRSVNRDIFEDYLWKVCEYVVETYARTAFAGMALMEENKRAIMHFYQAECFGMVIDWLRSGMQEDINSQVRLICELQKGFLEEMLDRSKAD